MKRFTLYTIFCLNFFAFYSAQGAAAPNHEEETFKASVTDLKNQHAYIKCLPSVLQSAAIKIAQGIGYEVDSDELEIIDRCFSNDQKRDLAIAQFFTDPARIAHLDEVKAEFQLQPKKNSKTLATIIHKYNLKTYFKLPDYTSKKDLRAVISTFPDELYFPAMIFSLYCVHELGLQKLPR